MLTWISLDSDCIPILSHWQVFSHGERIANRVLK